MTTLDSITLNYKMLSDTAKVPTKAHPSDACFDLYADVENKGVVVIPPHETRMIDTGFACEIPEGYFGAIFARSGLATKEDLAPANKLGVVDPHYRNSIKVALHNHGDKEREVIHGDRIAQFALIPVPITYLNEVDELSDTDRGLEGFGSSGK